MAHKKIYMMVEMFETHQQREVNKLHSRSNSVKGQQTSIGIDYRIPLSGEQTIQYSIRNP